MILTSLSKIWPNGIQFSRVLLLLSDAAAYMKAAYNSLHVVFPKMTHVTCIVHGLNRVAEQVRIQYPNVNILVHSVKSIFLKARVRVRLFKTELPAVPLPPQPVITRFATWLSAIRYYSEHFDAIKQFVMQLDPEDAAAIQVCYYLKNFTFL